MNIAPWTLRRIRDFANASLFFATVISVTVLEPKVFAEVGTRHVVESLEALREAVKTAIPGSVIEVADGTYKLQRDLALKRLQGKPGAPIVICAQHLLKAEFAGDHVVKVRDSEYLVLKGFRFGLTADVHGKGGALSVRSSRHCRIARNVFELDEQKTGEGNQTWLTLDGHGSGYNRIDHNRFSNKSKEGHFLFITGEEEYVSQYDVVEENHFVDRAYGNDSNGYETIRVGESSVGNSGGKSFTTIRGNLFERCQGEDEMVSLKVGGCSFLENTVVNCHGSVVFRDGNDGVFANNIVLNTYEKRPFNEYRSGGVRFYGLGHRAYNNYFEGLNGTSMKAPLALMHGAPAGSGALGAADGVPATECEIVHNTWVRCGQLRLGYLSERRPLKPEHCVFVNNIVYETDDERLLQLFETDSVECRGNILYATQGKNTGIEGMNYSKDAFRIVDPRLKERGAIYRLTPESPAINAAQITYAYVDKDMDGESRDDKGDIGADEFVPGSGAERTPLSASEVGPLAHD